MKRLLSIILTIAVPAIALGQANDQNLDTILERVRERVTRHYLDLRTVAWVDTAKQEFLDEKQAPREKPRELVYDTIIRLKEPAPDDHAVPFYIREVAELRTIDGKPVKKNEQPRSTDPRAAAMGPLLFLLVTGDRASGYGYSYAGPEDLKGRKALRIDVTSAQKAPPQVKWDDQFVFFGVRYRFQVSGVQYNKGRIWVDPETFDVLQLDWRSDPFDFQRGESRKVRYEIGMTVQFQSMSFENPQQTIVIPVSMEISTTINKGKADVNIYRTTHTFNHYKKFTGDARVIASEDTTK